VDRWRFDRHVVYHYAGDVQAIVPAETIVHIISLLDNTAGNKFNPRPRERFRYLRITPVSFSTN
jgi:hypothetical protein